MKRIILHHSLTKDGEVKDFDAIRRYHIETMGWNDIGYTEVIELHRGSVTHFGGRSIHVDGAHTLGQNHDTLGICLVGNFDIAPPSDEMMRYLYKRLDFYRSLYGSIKIEGHNEWSTKSCPGKLFPLDEVKAAFKVEGKHWADKPYNYLRENWLGSLEKRYDDTMTRAEVFSLLARILKGMED